MDSWLNMVLLCGLLWIASLQTTSAYRFRRSRSENPILNTNIEKLKAHYNTLAKDWVGKSVFVSHLDQLNSRPTCTCQAVLLEGMLSIYEDIFQDMMNKSDNKEVRDDLKEVINEVKKLKHKYNEEHKLWRELQDIHSVKAKNGTIQERALNDFLKVYYRASTEKRHLHMS
ncbi:interferon gamma related [Danio aesculapii]|uniref:interferon gamma related n=1 Tax=Danio aesculapii TaxID=1142201 RepID=UPI0024C0B832|nr:interferon gamma related [Danio aesculapii]